MEWQRPAPEPRGKPVYRWSRREAGALAFGLRGRIVATVVVVVVPMWFFWNAGAFGLAGLILWPTTALPLLLRDIWRRTRVYAGEAPPPPPAAPDPTYTAPDRPGVTRW